ncbi:MAG: caspase family protein [Rhizobiales bacterium]|nr:caspase family protein [Hyphomicrobiales bacterium]
MTFGGSIGIDRAARGALALALAVALAFAACSAASAATAKRVALVVGIAHYQAVSPLKNTTNDAERMAASLERLGFEVVKSLDPDRASFETALRNFGAKARNAEASVFFYAGHAIEVQGRNWLLPVDAKLETSRDLRFEALDVEAVLDQAQASRIALMFLDACRNNPFSEKLARGVRGEASRGLARIDPAAGVLVAFATAPGQVALDGTGDNSPFTEALLKHIETPGLEIRQLMARVRSDVRRATRDQVPWEQSALEGEFFFRDPVAAAQTAPAIAAPVQPAPPPALDPDALFWDSVRGSSSEAELSAYLERFPNGVYAALARSRLAQLKREREAGETKLAAAPPAKPAEPPLKPAEPQAKQAEPAPAKAAEPKSPEPKVSEPKVSEAKPVVPQPPPAPPIPVPAQPPQPDPLARQTVAVAPPIPPPPSPIAIPVVPQPAQPPKQPEPAAPARPQATAQALAEALAALGPKVADAAARAYLEAKGFKALALAPGGEGVWRSVGREDAANAEESALEACQFAYRTPCRLIASGETMASGELRSMPRLFYAGLPTPDWTPFVARQARAAPAIAAYRGLVGGRALALHPDGAAFARSGPDQRAAEEAALKACAEDARSAGRPGPCYLYAAGDVVVLPRRSTEPAAPAVVAALTPPPPPAAPGIDRGAAIRLIKAEMKRVGCYAGEADEAWNAAARGALAKLAKQAGRAYPQEPGQDLLAALTKTEGRVCPLVCERGFLAKGETCVEIVCGEGEIKDRRGACVRAPVARPKPAAPERPVVRRPPAREIVEPAPRKPRPVVTRPRPEPSGGGRCFSAGGRQYCS